MLSSTSGTPLLRIVLGAIIVFFCSIAAGIKDDPLADSIAGVGALHQDVLDDALSAESSSGGSSSSSSSDHAAYEAEFVGVRRDIIGNTPLTARQIEAPRGLADNTPISLNGMPGTTEYYSFSLADLKSTRSERNAGQDDDTTLTKPNDLEARQQARPVYISINTCLQPKFSSVDQAANPPQLQLYVSTDDNNQNPGPGTAGAQQVYLTEGYASVRVQVSSKVYIGVSAPQVNLDSTTSAWNYEIAASVDAFYHSFQDNMYTSPSIYFIDSDPQAALLRTDNLFLLAPHANATGPDAQGDPNPNANAAANQWLDTLQPNVPLELLVTEANNTALNGIRHSYCGLSMIPEIKKPGSPDTYNSIITRNTSYSSTEQKFYIPQLAKTTSYTAFLTRKGNSTASGAGVVHGGGTVFGSAPFMTKRDANCEVIYNLPFCTQVEYAVPANPSRFSPAELSALYNADAQAAYTNFTLALAQQQCDDAPGNAQYSLVTNCEACREAYKAWLCAVTVPRCEDLTLASSVQYPAGPGDGVDDDDDDNNNSSSSGDALLQDTGYLMPRNLAQAPLAGAGDAPAAYVGNATLQSWLATNSTRNPGTIGDKIQPGPYHEVLPCEDLCYGIVRHCPAALGFSCPLPGSRMMRASYGRRARAKSGASTCSAPGEVYDLKNTAGARVGVARGAWVVVGLVAGWAVVT